MDSGFDHGSSKHAFLATLRTEDRAYGIDRTTTKGLASGFSVAVHQFWLIIRGRPLPASDRRSSGDNPVNPECEKYRSMAVSAANNHSISNSILSPSRLLLCWAGSVRASHPGQNARTQSPVAKGMLNRALSRNARVRCPSVEAKAALKTKFADDATTISRQA